jgi:ketosteroid isomerase-like protein
MGSRGDHIRSYFAACTAGSSADVAEHFTDDAVIYDTNHRPVSGGDAIGAFWEQIRSKWSGAVWIVDAVVEEGPAAAIEWTMTGDHDGRPFAVRGSEHYSFVDDRIAEIRQYWTFDPEQPRSGLVDYPYGAESRIS